MQYSMAFKVDVYDFDSQVGETIITRPGDYIRAKQWSDANLANDGDELVRSLRTNYATAWFALKRLGRLEDFGLPAKLTTGAVDDMADHLSVFVGDAAEESDLPLAARG